MGAHELDRVLLEQAQATPHAVAIEAGPASLGYAQLAARACKLSGWLRHAKPHGRLGVLCGDPARAIPALLACMDAGWTYAPLDPAWPLARLQAVAEELGPDALLLDPRVDEALGQAVEAPRRLRMDEADALPSCEPARAINPGAANVFFTSGTTGRPKGILGRAEAASRYVAWEARMLGLGPNLRVSALAPTSFDASLRDALLPLSTGGTVCVPPDRGVFADGARLAAWLDEARVEVVHTVPTVFRALLAVQPRLPRLKAVLLAGEPLRPSDVARFMEVFGGHAALYNLYGPTETTMTRLCHRVTPQDAQGATVPLGQPMDDTEVFVLDSAGQPRGVGRVGEVVLRTPWAALGYLNRPDETARAFVPDLLGDGDPTPCYRTGDLGVWREDGQLEFRGRRDLQVKVRGVRVELEEVEVALASLPGVEAAAAALRDGPDGEPRLAAWVVGAVNPHALREAVAALLPSAAIPSYLGVVEALPRLINGKVDRAALRVPEARASAQAPLEGLTEQRVAQVLREVLGGELGATDDVFAELGMSSLQALQALWRLNAAFDVELPIDLLYRARTVRALGARLDGAAQSGERAAPLFELVTLREGAGPTTFWLPPAYGLTLAYRALLERVGGEDRALGLDLARPANLGLEGLASAALGCMRRAQPEGPYRLAGWSFGGVLAFEVARQLGAAQVERLVLLDSAAPGDGFDFEAGDLETALLAAKRLGLMFGVPMELGAQALRGKDALGLCEAVLDEAQARGLPVTEDVRERARGVVRVREACMAAWRAYRSAPYEGAAWVLRAADAPADWTRGWDGLIQGGLARKVVGGTHVGMLDEPHLGGLAAALRELGA
jgi:amino acid adenylation domain-containing protein